MSVSKKIIFQDMNVQSWLFWGPPEKGGVVNSHVIWRHFAVSDAIDTTAMKQNDHV